MRPILKVMTPENVELNALFIQPTRWCGMNCKGCYVKEHSNPKSPHTHVQAQTWIDLIDRCMRGDVVWANQLTISIDELPPNTPENSYKQEVMTKVFLAALEARAKYRDQEHPELHFTMRSPDTFGPYLQDWQGFDAHLTTKDLDMISFSHIDMRKHASILPIMKQFSRVNYNHLIPSNIDSSNIREYVEKLFQIAMRVDSTYLIIFKEPMCRRYTATDRNRFRARLQHDIAVINSIRKLVGERMFRDKFVVDGCLSDTANYHKTGQQCSSNISRFQVWPDGSVTGCPYAFGADRDGSGSVAGILANIRAARSESDFKQGCYLPQIYDSIVRRPKGEGS